MTQDELKDQRSLDVRFAGGLAWTAGAKWTTQVVTWVSLLFITRLLTPNDYGIGEMAGTLTGISSVLAEFGVGSAVLHMPELSRKALAQLNTFSCLLCTAVFAVATLSAPLVAAFYRSDRLLVFFVNNTLVLLIGLQAVPTGLLGRDMDYRRISLAEAISMTIQSVVTVFTAWLGWGYWALFAGNACAKLTNTILVCSWKRVGFAWPRWSDIHTAAELGGQTAVGRVAWAVYSLADSIVVGRFLGASALGVYRIAMTVASAPAEKISGLLMRTATPLFANVKDDFAQVRRYYFALTEVLSLCVMPLMFGLAMVAPVAIPVIFGDRWSAAIAPVRWLAVFMIVRTLATLTEQVLISQRMTRFTMRMSIFTFIVMSIAFVVGAYWRGMSGVASAWIWLAPLTTLPPLIVLTRAIHLSRRQYLASLLPALAASLMMCLAVLAADRLLLPSFLSKRTLLTIEIALGGAVYSAMLFGFFRGRILRYLNFLVSMKKTKEPSEMVQL